MRAKRWLTVFLILVAFILAGLWGAGSVLPQEQTTIRGIFVKAPVNQVWETLTNYEDAPRWDAGTMSVRRLEDREGKPVWALKGPNDHQVVLLVEGQQPPNMHQVRLVEGTRFFEATWLFQLSEQPEGTFVKLTQTSVISNPLLRFAAARFSLLDQGMRQYLQSLGRKFGDSVKVEELVA